MEGIKEKKGNSRARHSDHWPTLRFMLFVSDGAEDEEEYKKYKKKVDDDDDEDNLNFKLSI